MRDIILYGASGGADEVEFIIQRINEEYRKNNKPHMMWQILGRIVTTITDKEKDKVIGDESWLDHHKNINVVICIGHPQKRYEIGYRLKEKYSNLIFPNIIDPSVIIDWRQTSIGEGTVIYAGAKIMFNVHIGEFSWISLDCTLGHNSSMGKGSVIFPTCNISGNVHLLDRVMLGTGTKVIPCIIGNDVIIGAGSVVIRDIPDNTTAVGSPAKVIKYGQR